MDFSNITRMTEVTDKFLDSTLVCIDAELARLDMDTLVRLEKTLEECSGLFVGKVMELIARHKIERFMDFIHRYRPTHPHFITEDSWDSVSGFQKLFGSHHVQAQQVELELRSENCWDEDWEFIVHSVTFDYAG